MAILTRRYEKWGIDVDVIVTDSQAIDHIVTVCFDSDEQIKLELKEREDRLISNFDNDYIVFKNEVNEEKIFDSVLKIFESKTSITKVEFDLIVSESKINKEEDTIGRI